MSATIDEMIRKAFDLPGCGRAPVGDLTPEGRLVLNHDHLANTYLGGIGIVDAVDGRGSPAAHLAGELAQAAADVARRARRARFFERLDHAAMPDRGWTAYARPPSWATLTHPLLAYALRMNGAHDLMGDSVAVGSPTPGVRMSVVQDLLVGRATLGRGNVVGKVGCDDAGAVLELRGSLPETARLRLRGRPLSDLVRFAPSGDAGLDAAVRALPMLDVASFADENLLLVTPAPIDWIAPCDPPAGVDVAAMRSGPPRR